MLSKLSNLTESMHKAQCSLYCPLIVSFNFRNRLPVFPCIQLDFCFDAKRYNCYWTANSGNISAIAGILPPTVLYVDESLLVAHSVLMQTAQRRLRLSAGEADSGLRPLSLVIRSAPGAQLCDTIGRTVS